MHSSQNDTAYEPYITLLCHFSRRLRAREEEAWMIDGLLAWTLLPSYQPRFHYLATLEAWALETLLAQLSTHPAYLSHHHPTALPTYTDLPEPIQITDDLWIVHPETKQAPSPRILIESQLAFGTGQHPSTQLLLRWLHSQTLTQLDVCDVGSGSGILGIYACMRQAQSVHCIDIDPLAREATLQNAALNHAHLSVSADWPASTEFDLILSNCERAVLLALKDRIIHSLKPGGRWVITGIISRVWKEMASQLPAWTVLQEAKQGPWILRCLEKPLHTPPAP